MSLSEVAENLPRKKISKSLLSKIEVGERRLSWANTLQLFEFYDPNPIELRQMVNVGIIKEERFDKLELPLVRRLNRFLKNPKTPEDTREVVISGIVNLLDLAEGWLLTE